MGFNIMLVKDDRILRDMMEEYLEELGHRIESFDSAEEAIRFFRPNIFDVVVTDYHLPQKTGIDFIKDLRRLDPKVGVVIATADCSSHISTLCDGLHVWAVLTDVSNFELLREKIEEAYEFSNLPSEVVEQISEDLGAAASGIRKATNAIRSLL